MINQMAKRVLSVAMAAAIAVTPYASALAATTEPDGRAAAAQAAIEEAAKAVAAKSLAGSTVAGKKSTASGSYFASVPVATTVTKQEIDEVIPHEKGEQVWVQTWDVTSKTAPAASAALDAAAEAAGYKPGRKLQMNFKIKTTGKPKMITSFKGSLPFKVQLNKKEAQSGEVAVVKVVPGGATEVLQDTDTNPYTVTVNVSDPEAAYELATK
ncbi:MAG: hypothetical protein K6G16_09155 [Lachnospiraceae bacterium]|nr:hypothetical protein [Lachnospiraceae bacterium]